MLRDWSKVLAKVDGKWKWRNFLHEWMELVKGVMTWCMGKGNLQKRGGTGQWNLSEHGGIGQGYL